MVSCAIVSLHPGLTLFSSATNPSCTAARAGKESAVASNILAWPLDLATTQPASIGPDKLQYGRPAITAGIGPVGPVT